MNALPAIASAEATPASPQSCWICGSRALTLRRAGTLPATLGAEHFKITDCAYGRTADIHACSDCGFLQCGSVGEVLHYYADMADDAYEVSRDARNRQARMLLRSIASYGGRGRLLDVGAGSGIMVDAASEAGFEAEGIEPSAPLCARAAELGIRVHRGVLPSPAVAGLFDVITAVDVIEHVPDPVGLLRAVRESLSPAGIAVVVTPDVGSLAARLLGWRWWHYRIAHIGYFNRATLVQALRTAGLEPIATLRPAWYFPVSYLVERALTYLPRAVRFKPPKWLDKVVMPLNLFDSLLVVARKAGGF